MFKKFLVGHHVGSFTGSILIIQVSYCIPHLSHVFLQNIVVPFHFPFCTSANTCFFSLKYVNYEIELFCFSKLLGKKRFCDLTSFTFV